VNGVEAWSVWAILEEHFAVYADRFSTLLPYLNERERRLFAATEAGLAGYGGIAAGVRATGIAANPICRGLRELASGDARENEHVRRLDCRATPAGSAWGIRRPSR
jgi:hypothetical protein